jgi:RNA polymerase sigma-70 factor (ECF subfamily)
MFRTSLYSGAILKGRIAASRDRLYRTALAWCGDAMLADDLVQETLAEGIGNWRQLRDPTRMMAWLYTILKNKWCRHLQQRQKHGDDEGEEMLLANEEGPCNQCEELEMVACVRRAVADLPLKERQVIVLVDLEELSYCDVARILDIPIGTVMSRLHRARKHLLERMETNRSDRRQTRGHLHIVE